MNYSWSTPQSNSDGECSAVFCERPRDRGLDSSLGCSATRAVHAASLCARRGQIHSRNDATPASRYVALTCSSQDAGCDTGNELPSDGTYTYTYDQNGNTLTKTNTATGDQWQYHWDYHNQLVEAVEKTKDGVVENDEKFIYDIKGRLIGVVINGVQQRWTVFDGANVYLDFNGAGTGVAARYLTSPGAYGTLYARVSADGTVSWYITDLLGSVRQIVDTSGNVLDAIVYDPWGNIVSESNPANGDRFKYAGGQYDAIQGMYLFGARWENPQDGRWESPDPLGLLPDSNPYRYVKNQPTGLKDRTGEAITVSREGITVTFTEWTLTYGSGKRIDLTKEVGTGERILLPPGKNVVEAKADVTNNRKCPVTASLWAIEQLWFPPEPHVPGWWEPILERHSLTAEIDPGETEPFAIPKPLEFTTQGADWRKFFRLQIAVFVNGVDGLAFIERVQFRVKRK